MNYVPIINQHHYQILTVADLKNLGIDTIAYSLRALLIKPGLEVLRSLSAPSLKSWLGWSGSLVLILPDFDTLKTITMRSQFDGSTIKFSPQDLQELLDLLSPDLIISEKHINADEIHDKPIMMGKIGSIAIDTNSYVSIDDPIYVDSQDLLSECCDCLTCKSKFTRSYLHHLWKEVPILCQRYIVIHNVRQEIICALRKA